MTNKPYATFDDWFNEQEGFSLRGERCPEEAVKWVKLAWDLGHASGRRWRDLKTDPPIGAVLCSCSP